MNDADFQTTVTRLVREGWDLTLRQVAVLLAVAEAVEPQTVRGLAKHLNVSKPAITRALDKLSLHDWLRRQTDRTDRRSVLISMTPDGRVAVREMLLGAERRTAA